MSLEDLIGGKAKRVGSRHLVLIGDRSGIIGPLMAFGGGPDETRSQLDWTPGAPTPPGWVQRSSDDGAPRLLDVVISAIVTSHDTGVRCRALLDEMFAVATTMVHHHGADGRAWLCVELATATPPQLTMWRDLHAALRQRPRTEGDPTPILVLLDDSRAAAPRLRSLLDDEHRFGSVVHDLTDIGEPARLPAPEHPAGVSAPDPRTNGAGTHWPGTAPRPDATVAAPPDQSHRPDQLGRPSQLGQPSQPAAAPHDHSPTLATPQHPDHAQVIVEVLGHLADQSARDRVAGELQAARAELVRIESEVEQQRTELDGLIARSHELEMELDLQRSEIRALADQRRRIETDTEQFEHNARAERDAIAEDIRLATEQLHDLVEESRRIESELDELTRELERHGDEGDHRHLRALRSLREQLVEELTRLFAAREAEEREVTRLRTEAKQILAETKRREAWHTALLEEHRHIDEELERQRTLVRETIDELGATEAQVTALRTQRHELEGQLTALRHSLTAEHRAFTQHLETCRREFEAEMAAERRYLRDTEGQLGAMLRALAWDRANLEHEIDRRTTERLDAIAGLSRRDRRRLRRLRRRTTGRTRGSAQIDAPMARPELDAGR